jgi:hypothetical protein
MVVPNSRINFRIWGKGNAKLPITRMPKRDGSVLFSGHSICTEMRRSFLSLSDECCLFGNALLQLPVIDSYTLHSDGSKAESRSVQTPLRHRLRHDCDTTGILVIRNDDSDTWAVYTLLRLTFNGHAGAPSQSNQRPLPLQRTHAPLVFLLSNFSYGPSRYTERRNASAREK